MKIATYNVNSVNARLPNLLRWLQASAPDIVCLQELKAPQDKFPEAAIHDAGYGAIWHGQKSWNGVAILARDAQPREIRRVLPGDPDDVHSRYIEASVGDMVVGCLYLPNGNPAPGPKFEYKLRWLNRFLAHAAELLLAGGPVVLAGDYNIIPTEADVYKPERWVDDALFRIEVREAFAHLVKHGWIDALRAIHPDETIYTYWDYFSRCLRPRRRPAYRPLAAEPRAGAPATRGRRGSRHAWLGQIQRSCTRLDTLDRRRAWRLVRLSRNRRGHTPISTGTARRRLSRLRLFQLRRVARQRLDAGPVPGLHHGGRRQP